MRELYEATRQRLKAAESYDEVRDIVDDWNDAQTERVYTVKFHDRIPRRNPALEIMRRTYCQHIIDAYSLWCDRQGFKS